MFRITLIRFFIGLMVLTNFANEGFAGDTDVVRPVKFKVQYSFLGWDISGGGPFTTESSAIGGAKLALENDSDFSTKNFTFENLQYGSVAGWPILTNPQKHNLCHGWSSNDTIYPQAFPGTVQVRYNHTCAVFNWTDTRTGKSGTYGVDLKLEYLPTCPTNFAYPGRGYSCVCDSSKANCLISEENTGPVCSVDGEVTAGSDPINPATGNGYLIEVDYEGTGLHPLRIERTYNTTTYLNHRMFGKAWRGNFDQYIKADTAANPGLFTTVRSNGRAYRAARSSLQSNLTLLPAFLTGSDNILEQKNASGVRTGYTYSLNGKTENYDAKGNLKALRTPEGFALAITYSDADLGLVNTVTDWYGRKLTFIYQTVNGVTRVSEIRLPGAVSTPNGFFPAIKYYYDSNHNLTRVIRPDGSERRYGYQIWGALGTSTVPEYLSHILNKVTDENNSVLLQWQFPATGSSLAMSSKNGQAKSINFVGISNSSNASGIPLNTAQVNHATNTYKMTFVGNGGSARLSSIDKPCFNCTSSGAKLGKSYKYDSYGRTTERLAQNGRKDVYEHTTSGLPSLKTVAMGTVDETSVKATWDEILRKPTEIDRPYSKATINYLNGLVSKRTDFDKVQNMSREWAITYNGKQPIKIQDPMGNISENVFATANSAQGMVGEIISTKNAKGHTTQILNRDAEGRVTRYQNPNGLITTITYAAGSDAIAQTDVGPSSGPFLTTKFTWNKSRLTKVTKPDKTSLSFEYEPDNGALIKISDNYGDFTTYEYDSEGRVKRQEFRAANTTLIQSIRSTFNEYGQLVNTVSEQNPEPNSSNRKYTDASGVNENNLTEFTDEIGNITKNQFDVLDRLKQIKMANQGTHSFEYDKENRITKITDANGAITEFTYNGFAQVTKVSSDDAGVREYRYDLNGNLVEYKDARGLITTYTYDSLNRRTSVKYGSTPTIFDMQYTYDQGVNGLGQLTSIQDVNGQKSIYYDVFGRPIMVAETIAFVEYRTTYRYDDFGRLVRITYPSGRTVDYGYEPEGTRLLNLSTSYNGITTNLVSNIRYGAFSSLAGYTLSSNNNQAPGRNFDVTYAFDNEFRLKSKQMIDLSNSNVIESLRYDYDSLNQVKKISDLSPSPTRGQQLDYDFAGHLNFASGAFGTKNFGFDLNGNLKSSQLVVVPTDWDLAKSSPNLQLTNSTIYRASSTTADWRAAISRDPVASGKWYIEFKGNVNDSMIGLAGNAFNNTLHLGHPSNSQTMGFIVLCSDPADTVNCHLKFHWVAGGVRQDLFAMAVPKSAMAGKVFGLYIDVEAKTIQVFMNGQAVYAPVSFAGLTGPNYYLAVALRNNFASWGGNMLMDFGRSPVSLPSALSSVPNLRAGFGPLQPMGVAPQTNQFLGYNYDSNGNVVGRNGQELIYSVQDRLTEVRRGAEIVAQYTYDSAGQRTVKKVGTKTTGFLRNHLSGQVIAEVDDTGALLKEYIYLGSDPIAQIIPDSLNNTISFRPPLPDNSHPIDVSNSAAMFGAAAAFMTSGPSTKQVPESAGIYFYLNSHIGTPERLINGNGATVWSAIVHPFGQAQITQSVVTNNLRFQGQYYDVETDIHQNNSREYDPQTGAYLQVDPVGLASSYNPYTYANGDPVNLIDERGTAPTLGASFPNSFVFKYIGENKAIQVGIDVITHGESMPVLLFRDSAGKEVMTLLTNVTGNSVHIALRQLSKQVGLKDPAHYGLLRFHNEGDAWSVDVSGFHQQRPSAVDQEAIERHMKNGGVGIKSSTPGRLAGSIPDKSKNTFDNELTGSANPSKTQLVKKRGAGPRGQRGFVLIPNVSVVPKLLPVLNAIDAAMLGWQVGNAIGTSS